MRSALLTGTARSLNEATISTTRLPAKQIRRIDIRRRPYHSYDHPQPRGPFGDVENSILAAAYKHVPDQGFSHRALSLGARDAGYLDISLSVLADGPFSLIRYHLVTQRKNLATQSQKLFGGDAQPSVSARVAALTWQRLMNNKDVIHRWQEALATMAQPSYLPESLKELAVLSDEIWFLAGDRSVDPSWYTKRAALSMVYSSSELFMTNDKSTEFVDTNKFLQRRLQEVESVGGTLSSVGQFAGFTFNAGINALRSKGVPV
ncbi:Ubiquinone biosynthesis protein coq9 [Cladobotryum mycophilum]|uniref:Ubiquinone biosynthesis protein n=1 Tax=Cladobotryum mycophilum TaxID=491253 RepID=A0ABR0SUH3_9HYPO